ncbi:hypothetical protein CYY_002405 [Polysphondylium violaceum]|nr:hypothetical protein CYY_002405 [Polysphondylium violaceum]
MWKFFKKAAGENFNVNITTDYVKPLGVRKNIEKHHSDTRFSVYVDKEGEDHIIPFLQKLPEQFHSTVWSYKSESATLGGINSSSDHTNITERIRLIVNKGQGASGNDISVYKNGKFQQTCKFNLSPVSPPPFSSTSTAISAAEAPSLSSQTQPLHDSASQDLSTVISSVANIQISTVPICKFYRQKKCIYGKNCRNLHLDPK